MFQLFSDDRNSQAEALNRPPRSITRRTNSAVESDKYLAKMVSMKLEEGNFKAAVRLVCSEDRPAPCSVDTLAACADS